MKKEFFSWNNYLSDIKLLNFLKEKLNLSNKQIKKALDKGLCRVNGKVERFSSITLKKEDVIEFAKDYKPIIFEEEIVLKILYEDEYLIAIDKPISFISSDENIHNYFSKKYSLIHRLDKETSGVLLIAKTKEVKDKMIELFKNEKVSKYYLAIVDKEIRFEEKQIENHISKDRFFQGQTIYKVSKEGLRASTIIKTIDSNKELSLVLAKPITGRTHQIRVHLKTIGYPILGDFLYCKKFNYKNMIKRMFLHSYKIIFYHPFLEDDVEITSDVPDEFFELFDIDLDLVDKMIGEM